MGGFIARENGSLDRLFGPALKDIPLIHQETRTYKNGFVLSHYKVRRQE
jgi:hypothetical protein